jgi:hypothetical protein
MFNIKACDVQRCHDAVGGWRKRPGALSDVFCMGSRKRAVG